MVNIEPGEELWADRDTPNLFRVYILVYLPGQGDDYFQKPILDVTSRMVSSGVVSGNSTGETTTILPTTSIGIPPLMNIPENCLESRLFTIFYSSLGWEASHPLGYDLWKINFKYRLKAQGSHLSPYTIPTIRVIKRDSDPETTRGTVTTTQNPFT
ncbi:MAG TPA: hypothetical protein DCE41_02475 [Cytophagales bacterium]|nr:hypothetical protein [Cytophagales bacterium]